MQIRFKKKIHKMLRSMCSECVWYGTAVRPVYSLFSGHEYIYLSSGRGRATRWGRWPFGRVCLSGVWPSPPAGRSFIFKQEIKEFDMKKRWLGLHGSIQASQLQLCLPETHGYNRLNLYPWVVNIMDQLRSQVGFWVFGFGWTDVCGIVFCG